METSAKRVRSVGGGGGESTCPAAVCACGCPSGAQCLPSTDVTAQLDHCPGCLHLFARTPKGRGSVDLLTDHFDNPCSGLKTLLENGTLQACTTMPAGGCINSFSTTSIVTEDPNVALQWAAELKKCGMKEKTVGNYSLFKCVLRHATQDVSGKFALAFAQRAVNHAASLQEEEIGATSVDLTEKNKRKRMGTGAHKPARVNQPFCPVYATIRHFPSEASSSSSSSSSFSSSTPSWELRYLGVHVHASPSSLPCMLFPGQVQALQRQYISNVQDLVHAAVRDACAASSEIVLSRAALLSNSYKYFMQALRESTSDTQQYDLQRFETLASTLLDSHLAGLPNTLAMQHWTGRLLHFLHANEPFSECVCTIKLPGQPLVVMDAQGSQICTLDSGDFLVLIFPPRNFRPFAEATVLYGDGLHGLVGDATQGSLYRACVWQVSSFSPQRQVLALCLCSSKSLNVQVAAAWAMKCAAERAGFSMSAVGYVHDLVTEFPQMRRVWPTLLWDFFCAWHFLASLLPHLRKALRADGVSKVSTGVSLFRSLIEAVDRDSFATLVLVFLQNFGQGEHTRALLSRVPYVDMRKYCTTFVTGMDMTFVNICEAFFRVLRAAQSELSGAGNQRVVFQSPAEVVVFLARFLQRCNSSSLAIGAAQATRQQAIAAGVNFGAELGLVAARPASAGGSPSGAVTASLSSPGSPRRARLALRAASPSGSFHALNSEL